MSDPIYHLLLLSTWNHLQDQKEYLPNTYKDDGFIHCTAGLELLLRVANAFYQAVPGTFVVLEIDPVRLHAPVKWEPPVPGDTLAPLFPHIYGPINRDAIINVLPAHRAADGAFVSFGSHIDQNG